MMSALIPAEIRFSDKRAYSRLSRSSAKTAIGPHPADWRTRHARPIGSKVDTAAAGPGKKTVQKPRCRSRYARRCRRRVFPEAGGPQSRSGILELTTARPLAGVSDVARADRRFLRFSSALLAAISSTSLSNKKPLATDSQSGRCCGLRRNSLSLCRDSLAVNCEGARKTSSPRTCTAAPSFLRASKPRRITSCLPSGLLTEISRSAASNVRSLAAAKSSDNEDERSVARASLMVVSWMTSVDPK